MNEECSSNYTWGYRALKKIAYINKSNWLGYSLLAAAVIVYLGFTFFAPQSQNTLGLTPLQISLLRLSVTIPYILSWIMAGYGLMVLGNYVRSFKQDTVSSLALKATHNGLVWIIFSVVITALLSSLRTASPDLFPVLTILINYLYVFPLLIGFWIMYQGLRSAIGMQEQKTRSFFGNDMPIKTLMVLIVASFYVFLIFTNPNRQDAINSFTPASYYLPDFLIIATLIIPVIVTWWLGFSVAFLLSEVITRSVNANFFKAQTKILYGIWAIIFTSIVLQALLSLGSGRLLSIGLGPLLGLVYLFVILQGAGYLFISLGARRLNAGRTK